MSINFPHIKCTIEKGTMTYTKNSQNPRSTLKILHIILCKPEHQVVQKIKTKSFFKLTSVTVKQFTLMNLSSL